MKKEDPIEFSNQELQDKYLAAKTVSEEHLKRLDMISMDIRRLEFFLQDSGFGEFQKTYSNQKEENIYLAWDGKNLFHGSRKLIETKVKDRIEAHGFLSDFLESIALSHVQSGDKQ